MMWLVPNLITIFFGYCLLQDGIRTEPFLLMGVINLLTIFHLEYKLVKEINKNERSS